MKLTIVIAYEVDDDKDAARDIVTAAMAAVYNARTPSTPEAWTWELSEEDASDA